VPLGKSGCGSRKVAENEQVVPQASRLADRMVSNDGNAEEWAHVDKVCVSLLMLERQQRDGCSPRLQDVDGPMADMAHSATTALQLVWPIQIVTAHDAARVTRDRISEQVIVSGPIRASGDLIVSDPATVGIAMGANVALRFWRSLAVLGQSNANSAVRKRTGWARCRRELGLREHGRRRIALLRGSRNEMWCGHLRRLARTKRESGGEQEGGCKQSGHAAIIANGSSRTSGPMSVPSVWREEW
jgi:hypothetical protein